MKTKKPKKTEFTTIRVQYYQVSGRRTDPYQGSLSDFTYNFRADTMEQAISMTHKRVAEFFKGAVKVESIDKVKRLSVDWLEASCAS
jgi:hypothetical protein